MGGGRYPATPLSSFPKNLAPAPPIHPPPSPALIRTASVPSMPWLPPGSHSGAPPPSPLERSPGADHPAGVAWARGAADRPRSVLHPPSTDWIIFFPKDSLTVSNLCWLCISFSWVSCYVIFLMNILCGFNFPQTVYRGGGTVGTNLLRGKSVKTRPIFDTHP